LHNTKYFRKVVKWDDNGRFKCSGCDEFKLYRFLCPHTLAVAEHKGLLTIHLAAASDQYQNETAELILSRQMQPGTGKKPARRTGNPQTSRQQNRTVTDIRQRPIAVASPRHEREPDNVPDDFSRSSPTPSSSVVFAPPSTTSTQNTSVFRLHPVPVSFQTYGIRIPTAAEIAAIGQVKPLILTKFVCFLCWYT
jgi:hypothetical protein